jgi:predicted translin family RNA/ssDNA-binding protein
MSFLHYLKTRQLIPYKTVQLLFRPSEQDGNADIESSDPLFRVPPRRYLLGISDLSGELMRFATNAVGAGDITGEIVVADVLRTLRHIKSSLDSFVPLVGRELAKKQSVTEQSVRKIEDREWTSI